MYIAYIYKITNNINGKIYIGKTEYANPEKRWEEHLRSCRRKDCKKRPLYLAMNKYGIEHFHFEIIEETECPEEREQYWIKKFHTYVGFEDCNGYNATLGGDGKSYLNLDEDEVVEYHIDKSRYVMKRTAEYFNVSLSVIRNILDKNNIFYLSSIDVNRLFFYEEYGGVFQIDIKTKIILNSFENAASANLYFGKSKSNDNITRACSGKRSNHYAYGYLWYYGKDIAKAIENGDVVESDKLGQEYYK